jgi:regulatory protein
VEEAELAEVLARLIEAGLLDDERFARRYAEDKRQLRGWGPDRISDALRTRGVDEGLIAETIEEEAAESLVIRAVGVLAETGAETIDERSRARALSLLARRGYPLEVAYDAIRAYERNG